MVVGIAAAVVAVMLVHLRAVSAFSRARIEVACCTARGWKTCRNDRAEWRVRRLWACMTIAVLGEAAGTVAVAVEAFRSVGASWAAVAVAAMDLVREQTWRSFAGSDPGLAIAVAFAEVVAVPAELAVA